MTKAKVLWLVVVACLLLGACKERAPGTNGNSNTNSNSITPVCGNGLVEGTELCDEGLQNSDSQPDACRSDCQRAHCGDAVIDAGEGCDDGDDGSNRPDDCPATCLEPSCGDGHLHVGLEECDDGNQLSGDGCRSTCELERCGDGILDPGGDEECDDGNTLSHDGCSSGCTAEVPTWEMRQTPMPFSNTGIRMVFHEQLGATVLYDGGYSDETWVYDGTDWTALNLTVNPGGDNKGGMAYDSIRGVAVLYGGNCLWACNLGTWEFDGSQWAEQTTVDTPYSRDGPAMAFDEGRGVTVLFGGRYYFNLNPGLRTGTWEYDGVNWTEATPGGATPPNRYGGAMAYDPVRGVIVMFGGWGWSALGGTWEYDGTSWTEVFPQVPPLPRAFATMVWDEARGRIVMFGGCYSTDTYNHTFDDTWEYDGSSWIQVGTIITPDRRCDVALAYDPIRARTVLFGGQVENGSYGDTWEYDGSSWTGVISPAGRWGHAMAFDHDRDRVVLFGGYARKQNGDTWEFNGSRWQMIQVVGPEPRYLHALAYDSSDHNVVLFGGHDGVNEYFGDTWEYDGSHWVETSPVVSPPARAGHALAYDEQRGVTVLFGGSEATGASNATWEYDGVQWFETSPLASPPPLTYVRMTYDASSQRVVLFGGRANLVNFDGTWEYDGLSWTQRSTDATPLATPYGSIVYQERVQRSLLVSDLTSISLWEYSGGHWQDVTIPAIEGPRSIRQHNMVYDTLRGRVVAFGSLTPLAPLLCLYQYASSWPDELCNSGVDDDSDGATDCLDPDCDGRNCGPFGEICIARACQ